MNAQAVVDILMIVVSAATPLLIAAVGEIVAERAGVLNLGLEGMMIVGASTGFAFAYTTNSTLVGIVGAAVCGAALSAVFATRYPLLSRGVLKVCLRWIWLSTYSRRPAPPYMSPRS